MDDGKRRGLVSHAGKFRVLLGMLVASVIPVSAQGQPGQAWNFKSSLYLWGTTIYGTTRGGSSIDIPFSELLKDLNFGFMAATEARKGKWSIAAGMVYANISSDDTGTISPNDNPNADIPVAANVDATGWIVNMQVARNILESRRLSVDVLLGARYFDLSSTLTATLPVLAPLRLAPGVTSWDGVAGVQGRFSLSQKWFVPYHLDIGTGESDYTWQAFGGIAYSLTRFDLFAGYRYTYWDFGSDSLADISFGGPLLGASFRF